MAKGKFFTEKGDDSNPLDSQNAGLSSSGEVMGEGVVVIRPQAVLLLSLLLIMNHFLGYWRWEEGLEKGNLQSYRRGRVVCH